MVYTWLGIMVMGTSVTPLGAFMPSCVHLRNPMLAPGPPRAWRLQGCGKTKSPLPSPARLAPLHLHAAAETIRTPASIADMMKVRLCLHAICPRLSSRPDSDEACALIVLMQTAIHCKIEQQNIQHLIKLSYN
jgi:hypothetical protein